MLKPRPPAVAPQVLKGGDHARGGERVALGRNMRQRIKTDGTLGIAGVEIADGVGALGRDAIRDRFGKVAVWIDHGDPFSGQEVGHGQVKERRALPRARLPYCVHMPFALMARKANVAPGRACDVTMR